MKTVREALQDVALARTSLARAKATLATALADLAEARIAPQDQTVEQRFLDASFAQARGKFERVLAAASRKEP